MLQIYVDTGTCQYHGRCVHVAPTLFSFDDEEELTYRREVGPEDEAEAQEAASACPVAAIRLTTL